MQKLIDGNAPEGKIHTEVGKAIVDFALSQCQDSDIGSMAAPSMLVGAAAIIIMGIDELRKTNTVITEDDVYGIINSAMHTFFNMLAVNGIRLDPSRLKARSLWDTVQ